jgi:hypothetical protein
MWYVPFALGVAGRSLARARAAGAGAGAGAGRLARMQGGTKRKTSCAIRGAKARATGSFVLNYALCLCPY